MKAVTIHETKGKYEPGSTCWHPIQLSELPIPEPDSSQVLVKILAAGFNHRDCWSRQSLYPGLIFSNEERPSVMGSDAVGICVSKDHELYNQLVLCVPCVGWHSSPTGPDQADQPFGILGAVKQVKGRGTFAEYICVGRDDIVACPTHLAGRGKQGLAEAASVPVAALTAWRAVFVKGEVKRGQNVLITGIGGGVAIVALQLCVAAGANVWISSSSEDKIQKAVQLGAKGGVNYRKSQWISDLASQLPASRPYLDVVIDSGGGQIANTSAKLLKDGGIISCYGSASRIDPPIGMIFILKNLEFRGSTMGSRVEFIDAINFISKHQIRPVVDTTFDSLHEAESAFEILEKGGQFGKIVIHVAAHRPSKI